MIITTASQAYAIHLLQVKKQELTGEMANLKNNIFNAVDINIKQKKIGALNTLIESFGNNSLNNNEDPKDYYNRIINAFKQNNKETYKTLVQAPLLNVSRVKNFIESNLVHTAPPLYIAERDAAITEINDKIKDLTKDKQAEKISGLNALINLLMDSKHFDKSVADVMHEYKTNHKTHYDNAVKAFLGSDTKTLLKDIEKEYTSKPEQNHLLLACS